MSWWQNSSKEDTFSEWTKSQLKFLSVIIVIWFAAACKPKYFLNIFLCINDDTQDKFSTTVFTWNEDLKK